MTAQLRRKGARISARLRAEAALLKAAGKLSNSEIARQLRIGRESLRSFSQSPDGDLFNRWVSIAQRRLAAGIPPASIVDEIADTFEPQREQAPPSAEDEWATLRSAAIYFSGVAADWNVGRTSHLLETDVDLLIRLAAEQADVSNLELGHPEVDRVIKLFLNSCITVPGGAAIKPLPGSFLPWEAKEIS